MKENVEIGQQLGVLKGLTENTGAIHEAQVLQLKIWAQLLFGSTEIKVEMDPVPTITFIPANKINVNLNQLEGLDRSVKFVIGEYFTVIVINGETVIFNSLGKRGRKVV